MSRSGDARKRAFLRWEFARRNPAYKTAYNKYFPNIDEIIALNLLSDEVYKYFLHNFHIFPLNPRFSYNEVIKELLRTEEEKRKTSVYDSQLSQKSMYIRNAVYQLNGIRLAFKFDFEFSIVTKSYLTEDKKVMALRAGNKFIGLSNSIAGFLSKKHIFETYKGNLSRVTMELDFSYPTKEIIEDVKREISLWKQAKRHYNHSKQERQHLSLKDVKRMFSIYDLKGKKTYKQIAKQVLGSDSTDAIQKARNMFKKAQRYIEGGYKQIR